MIEQAITSILTGAGINAYYDRAPDGTALPYAVVSMVGGEETRTLGGNENCPQRAVTVNCWAATMLAASTLAAEVIVALDDYEGTAAGVKIDWISLEDERDTQDFNTRLKDASFKGKALTFTIDYER